MDDHELLRDYARRGSQNAFATLVDRHLGMVYSAVCRMVRDPHLAEEVAQIVSSTLAQKAASIQPPQVVAWLYHTTRHFAMHTLRAEQRRREREQAAVAMQTPDNNPEDAPIIEHLESAMALLETSDRDALVLRYLQNRSLRAVGDELGLSEDAARMRVNRALERLRTVFEKQGITVSAVSLVSTLSSSVTTAIPPGLGTAITSTALVGTATTLITHGTSTTMNWLNAKSAAAILGAALLTGTGTHVVQKRQIDHMNAERESLVAKQQELNAGREAALAALRTHDDELNRLRQDAAEVHRLRNELAQLHQQQGTLAALEAENQKLRQQLSRMPGAAGPQQIMEVRLLAQRNACVQNLRQIDSAKEMWGLENKKAVGDPTQGSEAAIRPYFRDGAVPLCPAGGTYAYGPMGTAPTCSVAGHSL